MVKKGMISWKQLKSEEPL